MTRLVINLQQNPLLSYLITVPDVRPRHLSVPLHKFRQLLHWAAVVVLTPDHVYERVRLLLDVLVR